VSAPGVKVCPVRHDAKKPRPLANAHVVAPNFFQPRHASFQAFGRPCSPAASCATKSNAGQDQALPSDIRLPTLPAPSLALLCQRKARPCPTWTPRMARRPRPSHCNRLPNAARSSTPQRQRQPRPPQAPLRDTVLPMSLVAQITLAVNMVSAYHRRRTQLLERPPSGERRRRDRAARPAGA
jgi:hypothetical protein